MTCTGKLLQTIRSLALLGIVLGCARDARCQQVKALGDTWLFDASTGWVRATPNGQSPSPRYGHAIVYDSIHSTVILFGGADAQGTLLNDIWEWDTASKTWTNVTPSSGPTPSPRANVGMAFDPVRGKVVLYGGALAHGTADDTWEWDPTVKKWTSFPNAYYIYGGGLAGTQLAYDPNLNQVILFSGRVYWSFTQSDTYAWDGSDWHRVSSSSCTTGTLPCVSIDPISGLQTWVPSSPDPVGRFLPAMTTDLSRSRVLVFGGDWIAASDDSQFVVAADTTEWDGSTWSQVSDAGRLLYVGSTPYRAAGVPGPSPRIGAAFTYDSGRGIAVLFGGFVNGYNPNFFYEPGVVFGDTWEWNGSDWSQRTTTTSPSQRWTAMVYDSSQSKIVLFGGYGLGTGLTMSCAAADGLWHSADVSIACTASDDQASLQDPSDASFSLTTNVPSGTETANAATNSRNVCDAAGHCATAGPVSGNKVDEKPPQITVTSPTATTYALGQAVAANFTCSDGGSGVATCGTLVTNGANISTSGAGTQTFTVTSKDNVGNIATPVSVTYTVKYNVCLLYDPTHAAKRGSTIPLKIELCDASGKDVSSSSVSVTAVQVVQTSTVVTTAVVDSGNANPDSNFRFSGDLGTSGGYIFNLNTSGLTTGTYRLLLAISGDPTSHTSEVLFQVK